MQADLKTELGQPRILIVEDEILIRMIVAEELRERGMAVIEAASADEALSFIASGQPFDLLFTDIRMPGAVDGLELAQRLRRQIPAIPIILTSGNLGPISVSDIGVFVQKPYDLEGTVAFIEATVLTKMRARGA